MIPDWQLPPGTDRGAWDYVQSERVAREYDLALAGSALLDVDVQYVERHFQVPGRLVDLGCGTGRLMMHMAPRGFACTGIDLSATMLDVTREKANRLHQQVELAQANLVELGEIPGEPFDYAVCLFSTLGMILGRENRARFLGHVFRLLRPGGQFIVHAHNVRYRLGRGLGRRGVEPGDRSHQQPRGGADLTLHHFTRTELLNDLKRAGFAVREVKPVAIDGELSCPWMLSIIRAYGYLALCEKPIDSR